MQICPFCDQDLELTENGHCSECGQDLSTLEASGYLEPLQFLAESLQQVLLGQMTPMSALESFEHWLGTVQQILNRASRELQSNLKKLARTEGVDTLEIIQGFGEVQTRIAQRLDSLSELFRDCKTIQDFENRSPSIVEHLEFFESDMTDLEVYLHRVEHPSESFPAPLPDRVRTALEEIQKALACLGEFTEGRSDESLEQMVEHLESARNEVQNYLSGADEP